MTVTELNRDSGADSPTVIADNPESMPGDIFIEGNGQLLFEGEASLRLIHSLNLGEQRANVNLTCEPNHPSLVSLLAAADQRLYRVKGRTPKKLAARK